MGFLGFIRKKEDSAPTDDSFDVPLPPPKQGRNDSLPSFADEGKMDELKLPDIPELDMPDRQEPAIPNFEETQVKASREYKEPEPPKVPDFSEVSETFMPKQHNAAEKTYEHTPSKPAGRLFPAHDAPTGDVFIRGEDYREVIEGLDEIIAESKEKVQEKDAFQAEEKELEKLEAGLEDLQRSLIIAEKNIFD